MTVRKMKHTIFSTFMLGTMLIGANAFADDTTTPILTLATYNIHSGIPNNFNQGNYTVTAKDVKNIADVITSAGANIVGLQEMRNRSHALKLKPAVDIPRTLGGILDMYYVFGSTCDDFFNPPKIGGLHANTDYVEWGTFDRWTNNGEKHGEYGNAILSQYPFKKPENFGLPQNKPGTDEEQRGVIRIELEKPIQGLGTVVVYSTHLHHADAVSREKQMEFILQKAVAEPTNTTVFIMGDLNFVPKPKHKDLIQMAKDAGFFDLAEVYSEKSGKPLENTCPAGKPDVRIDYILCSKKLDVAEAFTIQTEVSDHLPLVVKIKGK